MQRDPEIPQGRRPANVYEAEMFDAAAADGWLLTGRGWPDFFLKRGESVCAVEVKPASSRAFKREKARVMAALIAAEIPCFVWSPDGGFQRVRLGEGGLEVEETFGKLEEALAVDGGECEGNQRVAAKVEGTEASDLSSPTQPASPAATSPSDVAGAIERVWACYVEVMAPRRPVAGDDDRLIIRNALRVAEPQELETCIRTCEASDYHMKRGQHAARKGGKYNSLGKILKPRPRLGETQRARIDWWLDRSESSGVAGFPSADPAIVSQRQVEVQRGHQSDDPLLVKKAEDAEAWLAKHGIETVRRRSDGLPTFRRVGSNDE